MAFLAQESNVDLTAFHFSPFLPISDSVFCLRSGRENRKQDMSSELCPRCGAVRNMVKTSRTRMTKGPDKTVKKIRTNIFHCETCHTFVRSEDIETGEKANVEM